MNVEWSNRHVAKLESSIPLPPHLLNPTSKLEDPQILMHFATLCSSFWVCAKESQVIGCSGSTANPPGIACY
jgi:hypothetical protein